jgi:DNA invertase Pin-like site-specific DNA recombinase
MKYIVYCRKSTDEKDKQVLSIEAQVAELSEFAKRERLQIVDIVTEARTAKMPGRPQFEYVLQQIEKGVAQGILSWHPDRLARNSVDGGKIIYLLDTGVLKGLKFPSFWFEDTPQGKFMLNIAFGQSKYYVDNLSENVKRGNRQKLRRGEWPGKAPYGYFNNPKTRTIDVDPRTAPIIQKIFLRFAEGKQSFVSISKLLYSHDITRSNGKALHGNQIRKMLTNRFYIGILHYKNEYYEGTHERFISKEVFQNIQRAIQRIERPREHGHDFAFSGLATCAECGAAITAEIHTKNYPKTRGKVQYTYYRCTKKIKPCNQKYVSEPVLQDQLTQIVSSCSLPQEAETLFEKWSQEQLHKEQIEVKDSIQKLKGRQDEIDLKLQRLLDTYLDQVLDTETYKAKKNELFEEKLKLQEENQTLRFDRNS